MYFVSQPIVTNGLILNLDAGNTLSYTSGSSTWRDLSGNTVGTLTGTTYTPANGGGIIITGSNTYSIPNISLGTGSLTIDLWYRYRDSSANTWAAVCFAGDYPSGDGQTGWGFRQQGSSISAYFTIKGPATVDQIQFPTPVDGALYNYVATRTISGTNQILRAYMNGTLIGQTTGTTIVNLSTSSYFPGYNPTILTARQYYAAPASAPLATLHSLKVYNRDLSSGEIQQNFNALKGRYGL